MSIDVATLHRRRWWQTGDDQLPEEWDVSADVSDLDVCPPGLRHVGDLAVVVADLRREPVLLDAAVLGAWASDFIESVVADPRDGRLRPDLDDRIGAGPPRIVIVRHGALVDAWRGHGLARPLLANALGFFALMARLAVCHVGQPGPGPTREASAATDRARLTALLDDVGFRPWTDDIYVADLRGADLVAAREEAPRHRER
ncbi:hypothetical protein [Jiangella asiatica]|uniref:GNAT family N-acetyltransferase n=1 Tax=Jiangella asiatica TaxID=2530372 RepID=A0A4R5DNA9_9ACTN|nr:hypothetical protein [Jiangella asiatica]TDE13570.1 hypothetical protein E1269_05955 [Jiangella asiatica]